MTTTRKTDTQKRVENCEKSLHQVLEKGDELREELYKHEETESRARRALNIAKSADFVARKGKI